MSACYREHIARVGSASTQLPGNHCLLIWLQWQCTELLPLLSFQTSSSKKESPGVGLLKVTCLLASKEKRGRREGSVFSGCYGLLSALMVLSQAGPLKSQRKNTVDFFPSETPTNIQTQQMKGAGSYSHWHATIGSDEPASLGCLVEIS